MFRFLIAFLVCAAIGVSAPSELPVRFESNAGQFPPEVRYAVRGAQGSLLLRTCSAKFENVTISFPGSRRCGAPKGESPAGVVNLISGERENWRTGIQAYSQVRYAGIYPGIDLLFHGSGRELEYDFLVRPHANPSGIRIRSSAPVILESNGEITLGENIRKRSPVAYQERNGTRRFVPVSYSIVNRHEIAFALAPYDRSLPLVIDPVVSYSTYVGGESNDAITGIALDSAGNVYLSGFTYSAQFPVTPNAVQPKHAGVPGTITGLLSANALSDAFIAKLDPSGNLVYATYLGGSQSDTATGIALDGAGNIYVVGQTTSPNFPAVAGSYADVNKANTRVFAAKLNPQGTALLYAAQFAEGVGTISPSLAVDAQNRLTVCGSTSAATFLTTPGAYQSNRSGISDAYVLRLNAAGSALDFATLFGGSQDDRCSRVALDSTGAILIAGSTASPDLPLGAQGIQRALSGATDGFVAKFDGSGKSLLASTYVGGSAVETIDAMAIFPDDSIAVAGRTVSSNLPLAGAPLGMSDVFVARLSPALDRFQFVKRVGGSAEDLAFAMAATKTGDLILTGQTSSLDLPQSSNAFPAPFLGAPRLIFGGSIPFSTDPFPGPPSSAFVAKLNGQDGTTQFTSYLQASANVLALDAQDRLVVAGSAESPNLLVGPGSVRIPFHPNDCVFQASPSATSRSVCTDGFVAKLDLAATPATPPLRIVNALSGVEGPIAPGEIVTLLGEGIGPNVSQGIQLDSQGVVTTVLQNTQVLFDGKPAPLIFVSRNQINAVVPHTISGAFTTVQIVPGAPVVQAVYPTAAAAPGIPKDQTGAAIIVNQDGTLNSPTHKAPRGSIITLYVTGLGALLPLPVDGSVTKADPLPRASRSVRVVINNLMGSVLYAGGAPGLVSGVEQINVKTPDFSDVQNGKFSLWVFAGDAVSPAGTTIYVE